MAASFRGAKQRNEMADKLDGFATATKYPTLDLVLAVAHVLDLVRVRGHTRTRTYVRVHEHTCTHTQNTHHRSAQCRNHRSKNKRRKLNLTPTEIQNPELTISTRTYQ